ncbi:MAG: ABC transporter ATP-binding protein [Verrucomicrobiota bacterium]
MDTPTNTQPILSAENLSIGYPQKKAPSKVLSENLQLKIAPGELVCLLGPNGAGKSTLIRTLAGMQPPLSGNINLAGSDLSKLSPKEKARLTSIVLTESTSLGLMQVHSLVALGRHPHTSWSGSLSARDRERIHWALTAVDALTLAKRFVSELSDGERQKAMIARALAQEAPFMVLDEPTAFLDLPRRVELLRILRELAHQENLAILLSTHDLDLALRSADRLWLFDSRGRFTQGPPEALALEGEIAHAFANDKLDWDADTGSFRLHRSPNKSAKLTGQGPAYTWTKRLLSRLGYDTESETQNPKLDIQIENQTWTLTEHKTQHTFTSLSELTMFLSHK